MQKHIENQSIDQLSTGLLKLLESKGYSPETLANYRYMVSRINRFMKGMGTAHYSESVGALIFSDYVAKNPFFQYQQRLKRVIRRLDDLHTGRDYALIKQPHEVVSPPQFAGFLEKYLKYCTSIGNKEKTVIKKRAFCYDFLNFIAEAGCRNISEINSRYICAAILKISNKESYTVIRSFLRHLYETGTFSSDLSGTIPHYRRPVSLPTTYTQDEIRRLENSIDRATSTGKRDYAVILLASRLGIRAGDIARMTLNAVDFTRASINFIQEKTGRPLSLPLLPEIREAIQDYVQHARPNVQNNYLFIRVQAPFEKISTSTIRHALGNCFKAAGIDTSNKRHGPHTLRSSMASSMVNGNIPYDVVRKALGHVDSQAIKSYAKVDIKNLRMYALEVPLPSGAFAIALQGGIKNGNF
ncbi:MAG: tyrosine-type recombinase/integrase [Treponema sp.]|jgi:integrase|nr:tyrosine-type recombinase/integrase [Treponema sp.]